MKKILLYLTFALLYGVTAAMSCDDSEYLPPDIGTVTSVELFNLDNSGQYIRQSDDPIAKEAYALGIKYFSDELLLDVNDATRKHPSLSLHCDSPFCGVEAGEEVTSLFSIAYSAYIKEYGTLCMPKEAPQPGTYLFRVRVEIDEEEDKQVFCQTISVTLF